MTLALPFDTVAGVQNGMMQKDRPNERTNGAPNDRSIDQIGPHEQLHADIYRAVDGVSNLVRETARISESLDPGISLEWMIRRLSFLSYELKPLVEGCVSEEEKLRFLNDFFFRVKRFKATPFGPGGDQQARLTSQAFALGAVLNERVGAPLVIELIYSFLAASIGVDLDFVDLKPTCFLRWQRSGCSHFIDISRGGRLLSSEELIETLHSRFRMTSFSSAGVLEAVSFEAFLGDYVAALKNTCDLVTEPDLLLTLQDRLIAYRSSDLNLIGERALLHRRLGNFKLALADLKRYFAFHERSRAPIELVRLHDELISLTYKS